GACPQTQNLASRCKCSTSLCPRSVDQPDPCPRQSMDRDTRSELRRNLERLEPTRVLVTRSALERTARKVSRNRSGGGASLIPPGRPPSCGPPLKGGGPGRVLGCQTSSDPFGPGGPDPRSGRPCEAP